MSTKIISAIDRPEPRFQFMLVENSCSMIFPINMILPPPRISGIANVVSDGTNTMVIPLMMPGMVSGIMILVKTADNGAPRSRGCLDDILIQFHHRIVYRQNHKRQIIINHTNNNRHIGIRQILSRQPQYPKDCINNSVSGQQQLPGHNTQYKVYPHRKNHDNSHQSFFSDVQFPQYHSQRIGQQKTDHCTQ